MLQLLVVEKEFQGRKIGRTLLSKIISDASSAVRVECWCPQQSRVMQRLLKSLQFRKADGHVSSGAVAQPSSRWVLELIRGRSALRADVMLPDRSASGKSASLFSAANEYFNQGDYVEAISLYEELIKTNSKHAGAFNNLGAALYKLGRFKEAEQSWRQATQVKSDNFDAHNNLGNLLRWKGHFAEAEAVLRRAIKLRPNHVAARINLGLTLASLGRMREAKASFEKALKIAPRDVDVLNGLAGVARLEGRFDEAEALYKRALEINPNAAGAWAGLVGIRKMTSLESSWLERMEALAASGIPSWEETELRFAIGKYCDDVKDFKRAFQSYKRGNDLLKLLAEPYEHESRSQDVDEFVRVYTRQTVSGLEVGGSASAKPVFVVGMMRSGTSLVEQIISTHPAAVGMGELGFWADAAREHASALRQGLLGEPLRKKLEEAYLRVLAKHSATAQRIVDKTPVNADYLGLIHSIFPRARIIHMQRDPIDTCLSCYFQQLSPGLKFTMDLSDLAHYYREHERLMAHWHAVLPPGTVLDVPYAELVADQKGWTRKILDFIGLEWDERCLDFHQTGRAVVTASYWQVRQKIYVDSVGRWRNYEEFIGPLLELKNNPARTLR